MATDEITRDQITELIDRHSSLVETPPVDIIHHRRSAMRRTRHRRAAAVGVVVLVSAIGLVVSNATHSTPLATTGAELADEAATPRLPNSEPSVTTASPPDSHTHDDATAEPTPPAPSTDSDPEFDDQRLEITDPQALADGYARSYQAWSRDITDCMRQAGYDWVEETSPAPSPEQFINDRTAPDVLATYGYGLASMIAAHAQDVPNTPGDTPQVGWLDGLSDEEQRAVSVELSNCSTIAHARTPLPDEISPVDAERRASVDELVFADPAVVEAQAAWVRCLNEAGADVRSRAELARGFQNELRTLLSRTGPGDVPSSSSQSTAIAALLDREQSIVAIDIGCDTESRFTETVEETKSRIDLETPASAAEGRIAHLDRMFPIAVDATWQRRSISPLDPPFRLLAAPATCPGSVSDGVAHLIRFDHTSEYISASLFVIEGTFEEVDAIRTSITASVTCHLQRSQPVFVDRHVPGAEYATRFEASNGSTSGLLIDSGEWLIYVMIDRPMEVDDRDALFDAIEMAASG